MVKSRLTDIQRVTLFFWDPIGIDHYQFLDELRQRISIECLSVSSDLTRGLQLTGNAKRAALCPA